MAASASRQQRLRFFLIHGGLYISAVRFMAYMGLTAFMPRPSLSATTTTVSRPAPSKPSPTFTVLAGKPVRLVIAAAGIDLPIDEGYYDQTTDSWTLSDTHLQYAMMTMPANNHTGNTLIYGHGTDQVLGTLAKQPIPPGSLAEVYTDNGQIFTYAFQSSRDYTPDDTSIFSYSGPPILTVQTCTGPASEWRTMHTFSFQKVTS